MTRLLFTIACVLYWVHHCNSQCCTNGVNLLANYNPDFSIPGSPIPPGFENDNIYSEFLGSGYYSVIVSRDYGACFGTPQYDHTLGNEDGNYLWYDTGGSASELNPEVAWTPYDPNRPPGQENTIDVQPGTTYVFSVWIRDLAREPDCISGGAPIMGLRINGQDLGQINLADFTSPCCPEWVYLCSEWNSGNETEALIEIESRSGFGWTDLGIDDVYFGTTSPFQQGILGDDITICENETVTLNTNLETGTFIWNTGETTSSIEVNESGLYWVEAIQEGCSGTDSILVSIIDNPPIIDLGNDVAICPGSSIILNYQSNQPGIIQWSDGSNGSFLEVSEEGVYSINFVNSCGSAADEIAVSYIDIPEVNFVNNELLLCSNQVLQLNPQISFAENVIWSTGETSSDITISNEGTYTVTASNECAAVSASIEVISQTVPVIDLGPDVSFCSGTSAVIGTNNTQYSFLWSSGQTSNAILVNQSNEYILSASNECGSVSDALIVSFVDPPVVELGNNISICPGETFNFAVAPQGAQVLWSTGETTSSIEVSSAGLISVTLSNECVVSDNVLVTMLSDPELSLPENITLCNGESQTINAGDESNTYQWSTGESSNSISINLPGIYWINKSNSCGSISDTLSVILGENISLPTISDTSFCRGEEFRITLDTLGFPIRWENGSMSKERIFSESGIFSFSATNECGVYTEDFDVTVKECNCELFIPNTFTPNQDGTNDAFFVSTECALDNYSISIYNRWGELFFFSVNPTEVWAGETESFFAPDGVYSYNVKYQLGSAEPIQKTGFILLMR